jgi:TorA maturation chaperone TorD
MTSQEDPSALRMKPRETIQLAAVHVRIPEHLARGLKLMSVLESKQSQLIIAEMLEEHLAKWNPRWKDSVVTKGG